MSKVYKASPEEQAILANIASLVDEARAMMSAGQQPAGELGQGAGEENSMELGNQGASPQNDILPKGPVAPAGAPKPPRDEDNTAVDDGVEKAIRKAAKMIRKAMQASNDEGTTANEDAEEKLEDGLPESTEEGVEDVAKALYNALKGRTSVKKSAGGQDEVLRVVKSLASRIERQDAVLAEVLEGLGAVPEPPAQSAPSFVGKSQGNRPVAGYDGGQDFVEMIAEAIVRKSGGSARVGQQEADEFGLPVRKSLQDFTDGFGKLSGGLWGAR